MGPTDFLGQLGSPVREALLAQARRRLLKKGEYVFRVGDDGDSVFLLLSGRAKTYKVSPEGRDTILWFCYPGELFGVAAHPHAKGRMVSVQACEPSEIAEITQTRFDAFLDSHPPAVKLCLQAVAFRLGMLANRLVGLTANDAAARISKLLIDLAVRYVDGHGSETPVPLAITHQEIADITGVQRQTVTRIVGHLTTCGALRAHYRKIIITDRERLAEYAAGQHGL